jgi:superfamily II DNA or RNA helicase
VTLELRNYQQRMAGRTATAIDAEQTPCVVGPTGCGKTVLIADEAKRQRALGRDVLVVCHRIEILEQLTRSIARHTGEVPQIIRAGDVTPLRPITVAMVPTLIRRARQIEQLQGRALLMDECHHAVSPTWRNLRERLDPFVTAGWTATPITATGRGLRDAGFDQLIVGPPPQWLIDNGFLAPYRMFGGRAISTRGVHTRGGDYAVNELEVRVQAVNGSIIRDWHRYNPEGKPTICVGVTVQHSQVLAGLFRGAGITAQAVDGTTPLRQRQSIFDRFRSGALTVLCACAVVDEGLDVPEAACLQLVRPTKSLRLYRQLTGRVMRPKEDGGPAILIDHGQTWQRLPAPNADIAWSLDHEPQARRPGRPSINRDTGEVTVELVVQEDGQELMEVGRAGSILTPAEQMFERARKQLYKDIALVKKGVISPAELTRRSSRNVCYLDERDIGLARKWGDPRLVLQTVGQPATIPG